MIQNSIGPIRLRFFNTDVRYFYYELFLIDGEADADDDYAEFLDSLNPDVDHCRMVLTNPLSPKNSNTIQFVYRGDVLTKRQLSDFEAGKVIQIIKKIQPHILLQEEEMHDVCPDISQEIQIQTYRLTYSFTWSTSEALSCPKQLKEVIDLSNLIPELIDVDFSGLDMPIYQ